MPSPTVIPLSQPDVTAAEVEAVAEVVQAGDLVIGPRVERFEERCAKLAGRRHGVAVSSGTAGLHCAMIAAAVTEGHEVVTTPFSFVASANSVLYVGAKPVFVDIDPVTLNMDAAKAQTAITPRTKAMMAVEAFGHPGGMLEIEQLARRHELTLIEDACEGFGGHAGQRPIGSFGRAGVFSFFSGKQITTGEGGMIVTDDDAFAATCRALRNQGRDGSEWLAHHRLGYNYRMGEMEAALGLAQLNRLENILDRRRKVAHAYIERLMTNRFLILPTLQDDTHMSWFVFVVRLNDLFEPGDRDRVMDDLRAEGVSCGNHFPPIHLQPYMMERFGHQPGDFPVCEYVSARTLALPFFGGMTERQVTHVCSVLERALERVQVGRRGRF